MNPVPEASERMERFRIVIGFNNQAVVRPAVAKATKQAKHAPDDEGSVPEGTEPSAVGFTTCPCG